MACNCNKVTENNTNEPLGMARAIQTNPDDIVEVIYNGPTYPHYVPSPTGASKLIGLRHYGLHKRGDKFHIHKKELPSILFTLYIEPIEEISFNIIPDKPINSDIKESINSMIDYVDEKQKTEEIIYELNNEVPLLNEYLKEAEQHLIDRINDDDFMIEEIKKPKRSFKKKTKE
jgi:hypothetical protein